MAFTVLLQDSVSFFPTIKYVSLSNLEELENIENVFSTQTISKWSHKITYGGSIHVIQEKYYLFVFAFVWE